MAELLIGMLVGYFIGFPLTLWVYANYYGDHNA